MVFWALKKDAFTVIALAVLFGLISYLMAIAYISNLQECANSAPFSIKDLVA